MRKFCLGLLTITVMFGVLGASKPNTSGRAVEAVIFTAAPEYVPLAWMNGGERFPAGAQLYIKDQRGTRQLFKDFAATADANVSFDGTRLLFAGKKQSADQWQVFEASIADSTIRQVTRAASDSIRPFYLPCERVVYSAKQGGRFVLVNAALDGSDQKQISFATENIIATDVLRDGRILLNSAFLPGQPEVYALYSDGSGFESIRCDHGASRYAARELESGHILFTHGDKLAYFSSPLATETAIEMTGGNFAGDVAEISSNEWLVSVRSAPAKPFELRLSKPEGSVLSSFASMASENLVQPVVVRPRLTPKKHPSALHDWNFANLLALNVYTSKPPIASGSVASVRVYAREAGGATTLLGQAPVEADGSFFVRVPGDRPVQFELLDVKGSSLQREKGWFWARQGEQRICVGCHAGPERAPDNAVPMVLEKSTDPVDMTRTPEKAMGEQ